MDFAERIYDAARKIPKGKVTTYGQLAKAVGSPGAARAAGQAMRHNPYAPEVPCHRVVASDGSLHGFGGKMNNPEKARMLRQEGVEIVGGKIDLKKFGYVFP